MYEKDAVVNYFRTLPPRNGGRAIIMAGWCCPLPPFWTVLPCWKGKWLAGPACRFGCGCVAKAPPGFVARLLSRRAGSTHQVTLAELQPAHKVLRAKKMEERRRRLGGGARAGAGAAAADEDVLDV